METSTIKHAGIRILIVPALLFIFFFLNSCMNMNNPTYQTKNSTNGGQAANAVYIQGMAFSPATLTVSAGTTVTWTNKDGVNHTVTSDTRLFDSGNIMTNATYSYTFNNAGTFSYHCSIHSSMMGQVIVTAYVQPSGY